MDYSFSSIIQQVNLIDSSQLRDEIKLRRSGELIYQGSVSLLAQVEEALEIAGQQDLDLLVPIRLKPICLSSTSLFTADSDKLSKSITPLK